MAKDNTGLATGAAGKGRLAVTHHALSQAIVFFSFLFLSVLLLICKNSSDVPNMLLFTQKPEEDGAL